MICINGEFRLINIGDIGAFLFSIRHSFVVLCCCCVRSGGRASLVVVGECGNACVLFPAIVRFAKTR